MSDKIVLLASGTLTATATTVLYTNVSGEEATVMQIDIQNNTGTPITGAGVVMSIGADAIGTRIFHAGTQLGANEKKPSYYSPGHPLTGTQEIRGSTVTTTTVTFAIWGTRRLV